MSASAKLPSIDPDPDPDPDHTAGSVPAILSRDGTDFVNVRAHELVAGDRVVSWLSDTVTATVITEIITEHRGGLDCDGCEWGNHQVIVCLFDRPTARWWITQDDLRFGGARWVSILPRPEHIEAFEANKRNYLHEHELTSQQREDFSRVLVEWLSQRHNTDAAFDPACEISAAYHAGFLLAAANMILSQSESPEVAEVIEQHRIDIHPQWWKTDGWRQHSEIFGVTCDECGALTYGRPADSIGDQENLARAVWPDTCGGCAVPLPTRHITDVYGGPGKRSDREFWWADCTCGWDCEGSAAVRADADRAALDHWATALRDRDAGN